MKIYIKTKTCRYIIYVLTLTLSLFTLTGCYASGEPKAKITAHNIVNDIKNEFSLEYMAPNENSKALKRFYSLNLADYEDVVLFTPLSSMDVRELMIIKAQNQDQIDTIETAVENRVSRQLESFSGYGAQQCALLEDYVFKIKGNYVFYAVGEDAENMKEIFTAYLK